MSHSCGSERHGVIDLCFRVFASTIPKAESEIDFAGLGIRRILLQNISGIGNALMATPFIAELRRLAPQAQIDLLTTSAVSKMFFCNKHINTILLLKDRGDKRYVEYFPTLFKLYRKRYDAAFSLIPTLGYSTGLLPVLARIPIRVVHGYRYEIADAYARYYTHVTPWDETRHDVESNLDLLRAVTRMEVNAKPLVLELTEEQKYEARGEFTKRGWSGGPLLGLCPGSEVFATFKRWPLESYAGLGRELLAQDPTLTLAVFCGPHENECVAYLSESLKDKRVLIIRNVSILTYCAMLGMCNVVVTADSLPVHVCSALQTPLVALFGPTDPRQTGPWMGRAKVITAACDFAPLPRLLDPMTRQKSKPCMHLITVEEVFQAVLEMLASKA